MTRTSRVYEEFDWKSLVKKPVIGVDEAGRGCLAGRVYAGAVIIDKEIDPVFEPWIRDSKTLSGTRREEVYEYIKSTFLVGVGFAESSEIDEINILQASFLAMKRALTQLGVKNGTLLVDGHLKVAGLTNEFYQIPLVKGDQRAKPIAAASIVAKVERDRAMYALGIQYPQYRFEKHKGYSTAEHKDLISQFGPCPIHRVSFSGVREFVGGENSSTQQCPSEGAIL
ncbi:MAG: ribonuclease HII [Bdellovibrionales bacterium CG10_big_fil_rev_8_21_14_0_10_45_34]|nr:MAG: ribonuclease HII [Bdellovibrionales bacterium CG10_big_fil_rev_8_21_14_0_10_45_34]